MGGKGVQPLCEAEKVTSLVWLDEVMGSLPMGDSRDTSARHRMVIVPGGGTHEWAGYRMVM